MFTNIAVGKGELYREGLRILGAGSKALIDLRA